MISRGDPAMRPLLPCALCAACLLSSFPAWAGGGPFGIDHRVTYDDSGIWNRSIQKNLAMGVGLPSAVRSSPTTTRAWAAPSTRRWTRWC
jgi:hypothetical protein